MASDISTSTAQLAFAHRHELDKQGYRGVKLWMSVSKLVSQHQRKRTPLPETLSRARLWHRCTLGNHGCSDTNKKIVFA